MSARSSASRPPPPFALGVSSFGPTAAAPTKGEILVHLGATSRKPRSAKRKKPSSSEKDRPVPAKVQKLGESPSSPAREPKRASPPLAEVQNSGASPPSSAQELERASSPLVKVQELGASPPSPAQKLMQSGLLCSLVPNSRQVSSPPSSMSLILGGRRNCQLMKIWHYLFRGLPR